MALSGIPVKMFGLHVGSAQINDDGTLEMNIDGPCQIGKDLLERLEGGLYSGLSILAEGVDPTPTPATESAPATPGDLVASPTYAEIVASVPTDVQLIPPMKGRKKNT